MKVNNFNPSFTGYSNILSYHLNSSNIDLAHITTKLDDVGTPDLTMYRQIIHMQKKLIMAPIKGVKNDVCSIISHKKTDYNAYMILDKQLLGSGEELKNAREIYFDIPQLREIYLDVEKLHLKVYTWLADITKRMMNDNLGERRDNNFGRVIKQARNNLYQSCNNLETANNIIFLSAFDKDAHFQKTAKIFNDYISNTMKSFFR